MSALEEYIAARGMTVAQARKKCGLSADTFNFLLDGSVTLPSLALQAGRALGLTREETRALGKHLDGAQWKRLEIPFRKEDADPAWWERLEDSEGRAAERYLSYNGIARYAAEHGIASVNQVIRVCHFQSVAMVNYKRRALREKDIRILAAALGISEENISTETATEKRKITRWRVNVEGMAEALEKAGMTVEALLQSIYANGTRAESVTFARSCREGTTCAARACLRAAEALGVGLREIAEAEVAEDDGSACDRQD